MRSQLFPTIIFWILLLFDYILYKLTHINFPESVSWTQCWDQNSCRGRLFILLWEIHLHWRKPVYSEFSPSLPDIDRPILGTGKDHVTRQDTAENILWRKSWCQADPRSLSYHTQFERFIWNQKPWFFENPKLKSEMIRIVRSLAWTLPVDTAPSCKTRCMDRGV